MHGYVSGERRGRTGSCSCGQNSSNRTILQGPLSILLHSVPHRFNQTDRQVQDSGLLSLLDSAQQHKNRDRLRRASLDLQDSSWLQSAAVAQTTLALLSWAGSFGHWQLVLVPNRISCWWKLLLCQHSIKKEKLWQIHGSLVNTVNHCFSNCGSRTHRSVSCSSEVREINLLHYLTKIFGKKENATFKWTRTATLVWEPTDIMLPDASLRSRSRHAPPGGEPREDPEHTGVTMLPGWPGNASGSHWKSRGEGSLGILTQAAVPTIQPRISGR